MSDSEDRASPPPLQGRHEKSLGLLTSKFVELLQTAEGGILDLKKVGHDQCCLIVFIMDMHLHNHISTRLCWFSLVIVIMQF